MNKNWIDIDNRDIKFRVFDRPTQKMLYQKDYEFIFLFKDGKPIFDVIDNTPIPKVVHNNDGSISFEDTTKMFRLSISDNLNGQLMEYSGFKDMDGADIYEGDILEKEMYGKKVYYEVEHSNGSWKIRNHHDYIHLATIRVLSKVVGNIYQHRKLLGY
jgi:hypothetical protein